jgi:hypothetical protein
MESPLLRFYRGDAPDSEGRRIEQLWTQDDDYLERVHDYIQWLFPLRERSGFNPDAPVLTEADVAACRDSPDLRARLRQSLDRMLAFYGFRWTNGPETAPAIERAENYADRAANWLGAGNHNHLRLTRILRCLTILGLVEEARALFAALDRVYRDESTQITTRTYAFWKDTLDAS